MAGVPVAADSAADGVRQWCVASRTALDMMHPWEGAQTLVAGPTFVLNLSVLDDGQGLSRTAAI